MHMLIRTRLQAFNKGDLAQHVGSMMLEAVASMRAG